MRTVFYTIVATLVLVCAAPSLRADAPALRAKLDALADQLGKDNAYGAPVHLESEEGPGAMRGEVFALLPYSYAMVRGALVQAENWCDIAPLHLNVKACVGGGAAGATILRLYVGGKRYQPPAQAHRIDYSYRIGRLAADYVDITLTADQGPSGTYDYRIGLEAIPAGDALTFVRVSYAYRYGLAARLGMAGYFGTVGRAKIGFTKVRNGHGAWVYSSGNKGATERNAMRYYLAIQSFLDTLNVPERERTEARLNRWFDLTQRYAHQLYEMPKAEYLAAKRRERLDQQQLRLAFARGGDMARVY